MTSIVKAMTADAPISTMETLRDSCMLMLPKGHLLYRFAARVQNIFNMVKRKTARSTFYWN
jgi:hypothetical protein